jgi:hypothetical protein
VTATNKNTNIKILLDGSEECNGPPSRHLLENSLENGPFVSKGFSGPTLHNALVQWATRSAHQNDIPARLNELVGKSEVKLS